MRHLGEGAGVTRGNGVGVSELLQHNNAELRTYPIVTPDGIVVGDDMVNTDKSGNVGKELAYNHSILYDTVLAA